MEPCSLPAAPGDDARYGAEVAYAGWNPEAPNLRGQAAASAGTADFPAACAHAFLTSYYRSQHA